VRESLRCDPIFARTALFRGDQPCTRRRCYLLSLSRTHHPLLFLQRNHGHGPPAFGLAGLEHHVERAMETLRAEKLAPITITIRVVDVDGVCITLHEVSKQEQGAASFAMQHRALPATDMTGLHLWNCSLRLVRYLTSPTELPCTVTKLSRPLRIVDLGAGTGLLGLAVANRLGSGVSEVVLTDPDVAIGGGWTSLDVLRANVEANVAISPTAAAAKLVGRCGRHRRIGWPSRRFRRRHRLRAAVPRRFSGGARSDRCRVGCGHMRPGAADETGREHGD